jgi:ABC-type Mn2+/Zn2+ transport system permease subunit
VGELAQALAGPFQFAFMQRALAATVLVGVLCAVVGAFVVWKGLAFSGEGLAHASFGGVAAAYILGQSIYVGAAVAAIAVALSIAFVSRRARLSADTAVGVLFTFAFSLGVVLMSTVRNYTVDLFGFVFGSVLGVGTEDLVVTLIGAGLVIAVIVLLYKELFFVAFDPVMAEANGLPVQAFQYLLLGLIGITVVVSMRALGIVLVVAMLVTPAATASLLTRRFHRIMLVGAILSTVASVLGLYLSFYANVASGGAIVLVSTAIFLLVLAWTEIAAKLRTGAHKQSPSPSGIGTSSPPLASS